MQRNGGEGNQQINKKVTQENSTTKVKKNDTQKQNQRKPKARFINLGKRKQFLACWHQRNRHVHVRKPLFKSNLDFMSHSS